jgi:two-component system, LytTR family, sensor histidine kinase AlgZ
VHPILADRQRLQLHLVAWGLVGAMLALLVRAVLGTPWIESLVFSLPMGLLASPVSLSAWYLCRAMPISRTGPVRVATTATIAALLTSSLWAAVGRLWWALLNNSGFELPTGQMPALFVLLVGLGGLAYLVSVTVHYVIQAVEDSSLAARLALESQVAQRDAELRALRAQVDPHFLFNSLNSIAGLTAADPDKARRMCQLLGDFLRDSLTVGREPRIPLAREVGLAEQYLRIEQVRFGGRLTIQAACDVADQATLVPPLILQPLVENAVRHGVATRLDGGTVAIATKRLGDRIVVTVDNPRDEDGSRRGTGFGQDIVRRRLAATFGDLAALAVETTPETYRVTVTMPADLAAGSA